MSTEITGKHWPKIVLNGEPSFPPPRVLLNGGAVSTMKTDVEDERNRSNANGSRPTQNRADCHHRRRREVIDALHNINI